MNAHFHILAQTQSALILQVLTNVFLVKMDSEAGRGSVMVSVVLKMFYNMAWVLHSIQSCTKLKPHSSIPMCSSPSA